MSSAEADRQPHVVMDLPSRRWKAAKIEAVLGLAQRAGPIRLLEVGVGSGGIAHYFGTQPGGRFQVEGVDVHDNRLARDGYGFALVEGVHLPFDDASFDVVISNHVIEHVGDAVAQAAHLREIRRVLRDDGVGYLAVPNRWMLVEPHFRLPFLSWVPTRLADAYVRMAGKGQWYDCRPLTRGGLESLLSRSGLRHRNECLQALRLTFALEHPGARATRWLARVPDALLRPWLGVIPTLIYTFVRDREAGHD